MSNPYTAPLSQEPGQRAAGAARPYPVYCAILFSVDLVFCGLRLLLLGLSIAGWSAMAADDPLRPTAIFEIVAGAGIVVFGIPGNLLLLLRRTFAVVLAYILVGFTVLSVLVGIWQLALTFPMQDDPAVRIGIVLGGGFMLVVRLALLGAYTYALVVFSRWAGHRPSQLTAG